MNLGTEQIIPTRPVLPDKPMKLPNPMPDGMPNVIITGSGPKLKEVRDNLTSNNIRVEYYKNSNDLTYTANPSTVAAIFVQPASNEDMRDAISRFKDKTPYESLPIFAVLPESVSGRHVRSLYKAGVNDVFQWVTESSKLPALIFEHMKLVKQGRGTNKQDKRLSKAIAARLRVLANCGRQVKVSVRNGKAFVLGTVESLKRKRKIEGIVFSTPGINKVVSKSVIVPIAGQLDREITKNIQKQLVRNLSIKDGSISVTSERGRITLAGSVANKKEMNRVLELSGNTEGARSVNNLLSISENQSVKDNSVAKRAQDLISGFFIKSSVRISVIKDTAVLTGRVDMKGKRKMVEVAVMRQFSPISRVINNIQTS